jgi:hypothetical protein
LNVKCSYDVSDRLMETFDNRICLWISSGDRLEFQAAVIFTILANSAMNSVPRLRMIRCGTGHRVNHVFSHVSATSAAVSFSIWCILNCLVDESIMVRHHGFKSYFPFRSILQRPMRSTHNVSHGFSLAALAGRLPCFWLVGFAS